jgi:hypothetical protein
MTCLWFCILHLQPERQLERPVLGNLKAFNVLMLRAVRVMTTYPPVICWYVIIIAGCSFETSTNPYFYSNTNSLFGMDCKCLIQDSLYLLHVLGRFLKLFSSRLLLISVLTRFCCPYLSHSWCVFCCIMYQGSLCLFGIRFDPAHTSAARTYLARIVLPFLLSIVPCTKSYGASLSPVDFLRYMLSSSTFPFMLTDDRNWECEWYLVHLLGKWRWRFQYLICSPERGHSVWKVRVWS